MMCPPFVSDYVCVWRSRPPESGTVTDTSEPVSGVRFSYLGIAYYRFKSRQIRPICFLNAR